MTFTDVNGRVVGDDKATYQAGATVRFVWPGASVNPQDWPGWRLEPSTGLWVPDPSDAVLRDGMTVTVAVNPTAKAKVSYPPATEGCANPKNAPEPPAPPTGSLPVTGGDTTQKSLSLALMLFGVGIGLVGLTRRKSVPADRNGSRRVREWLGGNTLKFFSPSGYGVS